MLTESIAFFKNYDRLHRPAQDADVKAYVCSEDLWEDIDLQDDHPSRQAAMACQCHNPFCENHATEDEDLNQEWASLKQQPSRPEKHVITSDSTIHSQKRQKLTVLEDQSPKMVTIRANPSDSTLWRKRRARTRDAIRGLTETPPPACSQKLTVLEDHSPKTISIHTIPRDSTLWRKRRARPRDAFRGLTEPTPSTCSQQLIILENNSPKTVTIHSAPRASTLWLKRRARTRACICALAADTPPTCSGLACPLNRAPYCITHSTGPYVHNEAKRCSSLTEDFGGSVPPEGICEAYERVAERKGDEDDHTLVRGFLLCHAGPEAWRRLVERQV